MASKGARIAVGAGSGAATGAAIGSAIGPWGTAIGGVVGGIGGGIAGLLSASDEAKQRKLVEDDLRKQALEAAQQDWERRVAQISGLSGNPLYHAMSYEPYDPSKTDSEIKQYMDRAMPEWEPDYASLIGQLASSAATVGKNAHAQQWGSPGPADTNPWGAYAVRPTFGASSYDQLADALKRSRYG